MVESPIASIGFEKQLHAHSQVCFGKISILSQKRQLRNMKWLEPTGNPMEKCIHKRLPYLTLLVSMGARNYMRRYTLASLHLDN